MTRPAAGRLEAGLFLAAALLQLVPVLSVSDLPMQDLPQHLAKLRVLVSIDDTSLRLSEFYDVRWRPAPYVSFYAFGAVVGEWAGSRTAAHLWVALYVVAFPLSVRAWLISTGLGRGALAWLALPLVYHPFYYLGFTNLLLGLPLFFTGLALLARVLRATGGWGARLGLAGVALLIYLTHPFVLLLFAFTALLLILAAGTGRSRWVAAWSLVPALAALVAWASALVAGGALSGGATVRAGKAPR